MLIERVDRALRRGVVATNRFDVSPMNSSRTGWLSAGREDIDHAAADAELAVLVHRVLAAEAAVDEPIGERRAARSRCPARSSSAGLQQPRRRGQPRQQGASPRRRRSSRCRWPARAARGRGPTRRRGAARARGTDRLPATGTAGRPARRRRIRQAFERGQEEPHVAGHLLDVGVGRHDEEHSSAEDRRRPGGPRETPRPSRRTARSTRPARRSLSRARGWRPSSATPECASVVERLDSGSMGERGTPVRLSAPCRQRCEWRVFSRPLICQDRRDYPARSGFARPVRRGLRRCRGRRWGRQPSRRP